MNPSVKFKKLDQRAMTPEYKTKGAACFDFAAIETVTIAPGDWHLFKTGLAFEIPEGFELQMRPRSGLSVSTGLTFKNTIGTVDSDYRGEVKVCLINLGNTPATITAGDRIAQGKISDARQFKLEMVDQLSETDRGIGGFGSTGR